MGLPVSGTISMAQVSVELSRASNATTSLGESAVRTLAAVPSGTIRMSDLYGKGATSVVNPLAGGAAYASAITPGTATAVIVVSRDGTITVSTQPTQNWWSAAPVPTIGDSYFVKIVKNSGTSINHGGLSESTWYALSTSRTFGISRSITIGITTGNFTISISTSASDAGIVTSGTYSITAEVESSS